MVGKVTSPEKRSEIAKEFKRTHFKLSGQGKLKGCFNYYQ